MDYDSQSRRTERELEERKYRAAERRKNWAAMAPLVLALLTVWAVAGVGLYHTQTEKVYPILQAEKWLLRARATNDLGDMAANLNRSMALLEPYTGNPKWLWPTPDTDLDQIKLNIQETRDSALRVQATAPIGSQGYQQAVQNLQETIVEITDHLSATTWWFTISSSAAGLIAFFIILGIFSLLEALLLVNLDLGAWLALVIWAFTLIGMIVEAVLLP